MENKKKRHLHKMSLFCLMLIVYTCNYFFLHAQLVINKVERNRVFV